MRKASNIIKLVSLAWFAAAVSACGGGASTESNLNGGDRVSSTTTVNKYIAPEVVAYKDNVWSELTKDGRCGQCHSSTTNNQAPLFADTDIGTAYAAAVSFVKGTQVANLDAPSTSLMVTLVAGGHKPQACWLGNNAACATEIEKYIVAWDAQTNGTTAVKKGVTLSAPPIRDGKKSKKFPSDSSTFATLLHTPILSVHCSACHAKIESPFFASNDVEASYLAAQQKMDLLTPDQSRLVLRLRDEGHRCWSGDCEADAQTMEDAITAFAAPIPEDVIDTNLVISKALILQPPEAIVASGGERHVTNQIALWEFKSGDGATLAKDTSGVDPEINLSLSGDYSWVGGYGIKFNANGFDGRAQATTKASEKLRNNLLARGEYSIEAWVIPANVSQQNKNIISYSADADSRNFTIAQNEYHYQFYNRSTTGTLDVGSGINGFNGGPAIESENEDLQSSQQHIVMTYDKVNGRRMFVNGELKAATADTAINGELDDWDATHAFILANENGVFDNTKAWKGTFRMVAIHNRVLTTDQITQNFKAGVGEKFFMLFSISHIDGVPDNSFIKLQAEQFDDYSYLFNNPVYVNLSDILPTINFNIKGMRIGINGKEAIVGQSFINLTDDGSVLNITTNNQEISRLGSVIEQELGQQSSTVADDFFLSFEVLGNESHTFVYPAVEDRPAPKDLPAASDIGVRTFSEINATMAALTGVPTTNTAVSGTYSILQQQLPSSEDITGFVPANIIGISQLAFEYCDQLVEDTEGNRSAYFGSFDFDANVDTAFNTGDAVKDTLGTDSATERTTTVASDRQKQIVDVLYEKMIGVPQVLDSNVVLTNAPTRDEITTELVDPTNIVVGDPFATPTKVDGNAGNLFDRLYRSCGADDAINNQVLCSTNKGTKEFVKAMCTSVLGSAAMLVQ